MNLKVDRESGIIFNAATNNAVGFIGKTSPEKIAWGSEQEIIEARVHVALGRPIFIAEE